MRFFEQRCQAVRPFRYNHYMCVVWHQAVPPDLGLRSPFFLGKKSDVSAIITISEERLLPAITPLRDVVRVPRHDDACDSRHSRSAGLYRGSTSLISMNSQRHRSIFVSHPVLGAAHLPRSAKEISVETGRSSEIS